jgi:uncharacterized integral membrane protein
MAYGGHIWKMSTSHTGGVEVSFFALHGTLPLAMALLIAMISGILLTLVFGTARIIQLRRLIHGRRGRHHAWAASSDPGEGVQP